MEEVDPPLVKLKSETVKYPDVALPLDATGLAAGGPGCREVGDHRADRALNQGTKKSRGGTRDRRAPGGRALYLLLLAAVGDRDAKLRLHMGVVPMSGKKANPLAPESRASASSTAVGSIERSAGLAVAAGTVAVPLRLTTTAGGLAYCLLSGPEPSPRPLPSRRQWRGTFEALRDHLADDGHLVFLSCPELPNYPIRGNESSIIENNQTIVGKQCEHMRLRPMASRVR